MSAPQLAAALASSGQQLAYPIMTRGKVGNARWQLPARRPGLSHLGAFFARVLPGSDYRRTGTTESEHRGDWTWAQPQRKDTPRETGPVVSTPSSYGSA